jgi:serine/threonine protein kinase
MIDEILLGRYKIESELGRGGMGIVYKAHDTLLNRAVAVKFLNTAGVDLAGKARLLQEARAVAQLNHPNIVSVYDAGETDGNPFIVMELVKGTTLRKMERPQLPEALHMARQICQALEHAHSNGVIHRDLKLENIIITDTQTLKLMDFGLARAADDVRLTAEGTIMGTLTYLAPELFQSEPASVQSDLYAFGIILYELLTGQAPFQGPGYTVVMQHIEGKVTPPSVLNADVPARLDNLVLLLLSKRPEERPASARDVLLELEKMIGEILLSRYKIGSELGRSATGILYEAHDTLLNRAVAVKFLNTAGIDMARKAGLLQKAGAVARLNHPNIVSIYDAGETEGNPFIVMELVKGTTLRKMAKPGLAETLQMARQICLALDHAHANGVIHRDLKLENIIITDTQTLKLMDDFGLVFETDDVHLTAQRTIRGTLAYLAPELIRGEPASVQSDLYAFGIILYELLTGQAPFQGPIRTVLMQHLEGKVTPPSMLNADIPAWLDDLILRLLSKRPEARPASAKDVLLELEKIEEQRAQDQAELSALQRIEKSQEIRGVPVKTQQELVEQLRNIRNSALRGLVGGALGFALMDQLLFGASLSGLDSKIFFVLLAMTVGGLTGFFTVFSIDISIASYTGPKKPLAYLVGGISGAFSFALAMVLYTYLNTIDVVSLSLIPKAILEGGLWGLAAGAGTVWVFSSLRPLWATVPSVILLCGLMLSIMDAVLGVLGRSDALDTTPFTLALSGVLFPGFILIAAIIGRRKIR